MTGAILCAVAATVDAANVLQTYFVPFPENEMQESLIVIDAFRGNIGVEMRTVVSMVAGNNDTIIYYDHWEDGYEDDITSPTQSTTEVWGDGNAVNGIPPGFATDDVDAGSIVNLEDTIDVTRTAVQVEYDGKDKISSTLPITLGRAIYPIDPGEVIAEAGTALEIGILGTNYIAPVGWGTASAPYTNEVFEYTAFYIMGVHDFTFVEVDKDNDGIYETSAWLNEGETLFVNGGVVVGAKARGNIPFQCHLVTGDIYSTYETRWFTQWPVEKWSSRYVSPVGSRDDTSVSVYYGALVFFYNPNTNSINVICATAGTTSTVTVAANSVSQPFEMPEDQGAYFYTTNGQKFFASEVFDDAVGLVGELQDYDWGFSLLPADALTTMGIVGWGPGEGVTDVGLNGSPAWVMPVSNTTVYVDYDGDPATGALTDPLGNQYDYATNLVRFQIHLIFDNSDTNQTAVRYYTLDGVEVMGAWGVDPVAATPYLPYLDAGYEVMPFPTIVARKSSLLIVDVNTNGYPDPGDQLRFDIDVINVGFATANDVIFQDYPPTNMTLYATNSSYVNGAGIFDDLPPKLTRFPFDEGGYNIGTIAIGATTRVQYVTVISTNVPTDFSGYIHNGASVTDSNGNWSTIGLTNVLVPGLALLKTSSTTNLLSAGETFSYTITIVNTGQVTYTGLRLEDYLPEGVTYVADSTYIDYPFGLTNTVRDTFAMRSFSNDNGTIAWLNNWQEEGEADGPIGGDVQVRGDTNVSPIESYALFVSGAANAAWRSADLSGHNSAFLSFRYRREGLDDVNEYADIYLSTNGWVSSNYLGRFQGLADDAAYSSTNIEISAYISTNTALKFVSSAGNEAGEGVWFDDVAITLTGSNVTFAGGAPPLLFNGLKLPPGSNIVASFDVTVNDPPTATQLVNTARIRADQHAQWLYAYATNDVDARSSLEIFKTNNPSGQVGPGSNITYTIRLVNTGDVVQTQVALEDILPIGVTYVPDSAFVWRGYPHTNTFRDQFDFQVYTNSDGNLDWADAWDETGDDDDPTAGSIQVANDGGTVPGRVYALRIATTDSIARGLNLGGGYTAAILSVEYRREGPDAGEYVRVDASSNGGGSWTEVGRFSGAGTDSQYFPSNINISAHISTNTAIRFVGVGLDAGEYVWFDNVTVYASGQNATNKLDAPAAMFEGYHIPPHTSLVVTLQVTVDNPATVTQMINTARARSAQKPDWAYAYATNWQTGILGLSLSKTSSVNGSYWGLYETNTYTITIVNTGSLAQTGIRVSDLLPSGTVYVAGSTVVVAPAYRTNVTTNVTVTTITNTVRDEFNLRAYTNSNGTINWSGNWTEEGDDGNVTAGDVLVQNVLDTWELVTKDNENGAYRNFSLTGYTNAVLSFDWARFGLDGTDYYAIYMSSNNGTSYTQLLQINGNGGTDGSFSSTNFNITAFISGNMRVRFYSADTTVADDEGMRWDNVQILALAPLSVTNISTNIAWVASTNAGGAPSALATNVLLPTGGVMTVTFKATLPFPTDYSAITNTVRVWSDQVTNLQASVTDLVARVVIGDRVWFDSNTNGLQDAGEPGVTNVTVRLYDGRTNLVATTTTDANGLYFFSGWPATNYFVEFVKPSNYWFTLRDQGGSDTNDSDPDTTSGRTAIFTLTGATNDYSWDAGLYSPPASIGDWAWFDDNTNGIQDAGESGLTSVVVRLYDGGSNLVATTTNDASGYYSFTGLQAGNYFLEFSSPSGYVFTLADQGASNTNDSDVSQSTGRTPIFYLSVGTNDTTWDVGYVRPRIGLRITKTSNAGGTCWDPGDTITYTIVVVNTGAFRQVGVAVEDIFPAGVTWVPGSIDIKAPSTGATGSPPVLASGYRLDGGEGMTVTVQAAVSLPGVTNTLVNVAQTYSATHPTIQASHTDCVVSADLGVVKDVTDSTPAEVQFIEWIITITNNGPDTATGVQIWDALPAEVQYNSHSNGAYDNGSRIWTIGTLAVGSSTTLYIHCTVREDTKGMTITNQARVHARDLFDPVSTNDQDDAVITVTYIVLSRFEAAMLDGVPGIEWETASEHATIGFDIYRLVEESGEYVRVNDRFLPATIVAPQGGVYRLADPGAIAGATYTYRLDEIERGGRVNSYGPFVVTMPKAAAKKRGLAASAPAPFERVVRSSDFSKDRRVTASKAVPSPKRVAATLRDKKTKNDSPADWPSVKMTVNRDGICFVSIASLAATIGQSEADVANAIAALQASVENRGRTCSFIPAADGLFFYGEAIDEPWATNNVYWVRWTGGRAVSSVGGIFPIPAENTSFTGSVHIEENRYATPALADDPASDYWYWDYCIAGDPALGSRAYAIVPAGLSPNAGTAELVARLQGGSDTVSPADHRVTLSVNGTEVGQLSWDGVAAAVATCRFDRALLVDGTNTVTVAAALGVGAPYGVVYVDSFDLRYPRAYQAVDNQLILTGDGNPAVTVGGLASSNVWVLNVADPAAPVSLTGYTVDEDEGAYRVTFAPLNAATRYCVFAAEPAPPAPASMTARVSANLRSRPDPVRYILITVPELAAACQELADYREATLDRKGLVVLLEDVYDEFADGIAEPAAIRRFLAFAAENWGPSSSSPYHVVLCGEGTFDYLDHMGTGDNVVPAMMVPTPYGLCPSDGWYADLDDDGVPDMAIGRIPALTHAEMTSQVARIIQYETGEGGEWRQSVVLAADNPDRGGGFHASSDSIGALMPRDYTVSRHHMESNDGGATRAALLAALGRGALILNYFGHGGMDRMAQEGLFRTADAVALTNATRRPVVVSLSCSLGQFALPGYDCLAEALMLADGGAVAVWAPSSVAYNRESGKLADGLYRAAFREGDIMLGDAIQSATKSYAHDKTAMEIPMIYNLLGDPALQLGGAASLGPEGTFEEWKDEQFSDAELADDDIGGADADPDGDGLSNFEEYARGWNPRAADGDDLIVITRKASGNPPESYDVVFRYSRRKDASDLTFSVESSEDVSAWLDEPGVITGTDVTDDGNGVSETVNVYVSIPSGRVSSHLFLRLRVSKN